jgi:hypothetical protein
MMALTPPLALHTARRKENKNANPSLTSPLASTRLTLIPYDAERALRQDARKHRYVVVDRTCIGEQCIGRDEGGDRREKRKQAVEDDACGDREQTVFADLPVGPDQDVLPPSPGNLPWRYRAAAAALIACRR